MRKNRIRLYWMLLLTVVLTGTAVSAVGVTQARYQNTVTMVAVLQTADQNITSNCLVGMGEASRTVLLGEMDTEQGITVPFWLQSAGTDRAVKLDWSVSDAAHAEYVDIAVFNGSEMLIANDVLALPADTEVALKLQLQPTEKLRTTSHKEIELEVRLTLDNTMQGIFRVSLPEVEIIPANPTEPPENNTDNTESTEETTEATESDASEETTESVESTETTESEESTETTESTGTTETTESDESEEGTETTDLESSTEVTESGETETALMLFAESGATDTEETTETSETEESTETTETTESDASEKTSETEEADASTETIENSETEESGTEEDTTESDQEDETDGKDGAGGTVQEEHYSDEQIALRTIAAFDLTEQLPVQMVLADHITSVRLGLHKVVDGAEALEALPDYTMFSVDGGSNYYMVYGDFVPELLAEEIPSVPLLMDFGCTNLEQNGELTIAMEAYMGSKLRKTCAATTATTVHKNTVYWDMYIPDNGTVQIKKYENILGPSLDLDDMLEFHFPEAWDEAAPDFTIEMLRMTEQQELQYVPVEAADSILKIEYTKDEHRLVLLPDEKLTQPGTYRIRISWSYKGLCFDTTETTFWVNCLKRGKSVTSSLEVLNDE